MTSEPGPRRVVLGDGDGVRLELEPGSSSPFSTVRYELAVRGRAVTVVQRKELPGHPEGLHEARLLTRDELLDVEQLLGRCDIARLRDAVRSPVPQRARGAAMTWRLELDAGDARHTVRVTDPANQPDPCYAELFDGFRRMVASRTGPLPFRNVFFEAGHLGWLTVRSIPAAAVHVDGFDTQHGTPVYAYELRSGEHDIRLVSEDGMYDRTYRVRVEPGGTTHLAVDLR